MLLQQIKTWTAIRTLQSRSRLDRASNLFIIDTSSVKERVETAKKEVTWADATGVTAAAAKVALESGCSITIKKGPNDSTRPSKSAGPDPQPSTTCTETKTLLTRMPSNVTALMQSFNYHSPAAASCLPREGMWRPCEQAEQLEIPGKSLVETNQYVFHNPHDMLGSVPITLYAAQSLEDSALVEERDKDILRVYFQDPSNIVLHSDCPHLAPHIVVTPAEESPNDFYTPWNNRTLPQWPGFLMIPPYNLATSRLHPPSYHLQSPEVDSQCSDDDTLVDENIQVKNVTAISSEDLKRAFCHSRFTSFVEATANERLILYHVVKALQKHQCKVVAFMASARAAGFCRRYASPDFLASIDKPFTWTDPAEPLLSSAKYMLGTTVLESSCPFVAPHILINTPPPQNPWIPWHNAVNDPQDGRYLTIPSPRVNYINMDEDEGEEPEPKWTASSATSSRFFLVSDDEEEDDFPEDAYYEDEDDLEVDQSESPPYSRPSSPGPETPTDDSTFLRGFFSVRRPNFVIDEDDEDDRALALAIARNAVEEYYKQGASLLPVSLPVIEEEDSLDVEGFSPMHPSVPVQVMPIDEEDDLPFPDDWYQRASKRAGLTPAVQVAFA